RRLRRRRIAIGDLLPEVGVMIEVPGAALAADSLARESEFFAIGTNDLTMYTLAIDRGDEQVADLYDPLHPGVLRLIQLTVDAANRRGIDVSVCGEMAGNPRHATLLVGMGLRQLSMTPNSLPRVKQRIRQLDGAAAARRAQTILDQYDPERVSALLDEFIEAL
ncbi:MAG: putative PEP-binding protein, partial [Pseudomonadota bacterium]|nr:putative PEP-binding protein [Pseudomonadota bacterium]